MSNYTEEELQAKRTAFRSQSIRAVANTQSEYMLLNALYQKMKNNYNSCVNQRKFNHTGFYRDPDNSTRTIYLKQLEEKQRYYLEEMKKAQKKLDDLLSSI